jgi:uncharacterized lipoprotein YehR (DUF1307 family)
MFSHRKVFALLVVAMAVLALTGCESEVKKKQRLEREMVVEASHKIETALLTTKKVQDVFLKVVKSLSPDSGEAKLKELKKFFTDSENTFRNIEQELQKIKLPDSIASDNFRASYLDLIKSLIETFADFNKNYDINDSNPWDAKTQLRHVVRNIGYKDFSLLDLQTTELIASFESLCKFYNVPLKSLKK